MKSLLNILIIFSSAVNIMVAVCEDMSISQVSPGLHCKHDSDKIKFFNEADVGYLQRIVDSMWNVCDANLEMDKESNSWLQCSSNLLYCEGGHIGIDLREASTIAHSLKYSMDVLKKGNVFMAKTCSNFNMAMLEKNLNHMAALQSWAPELRHLIDSDEESACDYVESKPTILLKLDAVVNMYHHFCDFLNLFLSLRIHHMRQRRDKKWVESVFNPENELQLLIWDNGKYISPLSTVFSAFSAAPLLNLRSYGGRRVCFKHLMFSMPPRMLFGLFYNTPLTPECSNSSVINAFSKHIVNKVKVNNGFDKRPKEQRRPPRVDERLKVTLIARQTQHRRILNQLELVKALDFDFDVNVANFTHSTDFREQLRLIVDTDILIGIHGAGLTHLLFLPDWAVVFELYHCDDPDCYRDLSRLRGLDYITWDDETKVQAKEMGREPDEKRYNAYKKFANYVFDVDHFVNRVEVAAERVREKCKTFQSKDEL